MILAASRIIESAPDELWVADITCVPELAGLLYVAVVLDVFSRRIVGWAVNRRMPIEFVVSALDTAVFRAGERASFITPTGSQYTSITLSKRCNQAGLTMSIGSVGDCYDNTMSEVSMRHLSASFWRSIDLRISAELSSASLTSAKAFTTCGDVTRRPASCRQSTPFSTIS
jgi:hypothetical protein